MQDGMLIHIPMSRKPININIHNMAKSEVYNTDCIEYMRTLPDNHFDLAVCDPPYGHGNDESLLGGGAEVRTAVPTVFRPTASEDCSTATSSQWNRLKGGRRERYYSIESGGVNCKLHNGTLLLRRSSSMSCSASAAIK